MKQWWICFKLLWSHPVWDEWIEIVKAICGRHDYKGSHPVWDEWIEITGPIGPQGPKGSHPVWDEWIEMNTQWQRIRHRPSHPVWDEWIEMPGRKKDIWRLKRLIPFGMSGLKFRCCTWMWSTRWSHPVWDEWIEMSTDHPSSGYSSLSHPVWDEWIEMMILCVILSECSVSSRLGWVDWNVDRPS